MNFFKKIFCPLKETTENIVSEIEKEFNFNDYLDENFTWIDDIRPTKKAKKILCFEEIVDDVLKKKYKTVTYKTRKDISHNYTNGEFIVIINKHGLTVWDIKHEYLRIYQQPIPQTREETDCIFGKLK
jgi:hypothetical protein